MIPTTEPIDLNAGAAACFDEMCRRSAMLRCRPHDWNGATLLDAGIEVPGGLEAGVGLARLCFGDAARVSIVPSESGVTDNQVFVSIDQPVLACLGGQYAGWPVSVESEKFFAMASGPMRMRRGKEAMLTELGLIQTADPLAIVVGVLESDRLPSLAVLQEIADQCESPLDRLCIAVAPVTSIAGSVQVVARSVETALHKLHAVGFDVTKVASATGSAPLPPCAKPGDTIGGIGRTNDAILYGAKVTLWIDSDDESIDAVAAKIPSESSTDHGRPFKEIFKDYGYDFYKVDPLLFSPAVVTIHSLQTGQTWRCGRTMPEVLRKSFKLESA